MTTGANLTTDEWHLMHQMREAGLTTLEIAAGTGRHPATVWKVLRQEEPPVAKKRGGRPGPTECGEVVSPAKIMLNPPNHIAHRLRNLMERERMLLAPEYRDWLENQP